MKRTVFDRVIIVFILAVIIIFTVFTLYTVNTTEKNILASTEDNIKSESQLLLNFTISDYVNENITFEEFSEDLNESAALMGCEIWFSNADGEITYCSAGDSSMSDPALIADYFDEGLIYSSQTLNGTLNGYFSSKTLSVLNPVYLNGKYVGLLVINQPLDFINEITSQTLSSTYMPFMIIVVLSLIVLMWASNSTLKPIREIIATSKQYAAGNFNARINVKVNNEFGELARYMEEMADQLNRSNESRRSFISNISHDFRSPLTSIKGYIEAMIDGTIPPEQYDKYLNIVLNETKRLTKLTQGLLDLNNFDSYDLQLDKSNFDIKDVVTSTINTFERRCQDKGVYLHAIYHTENTVVYADRTKIQQVVYNLVDNAIKFTPGGCHITVQVTEKNEKIYVSVKDEGEGIPPESLKKVFDRFYKTDPSRGKDKTGTGLGLAITKEIIKAHGEQITVASKVNQGSEFIFSLPLQKEMQVPIKAVHVKNEDSQYITNGKFKIKKN